MLCAVKRNMAFVDGFLGKDGFLEDRDMELLATIRKLYAQQKEMFDEKKHRVAERIVSVTQPYVRPIVRGKVKDPVESGAKYDVSVEKRCCGAGLIMTKLSKTTLGSIALSVLVANLFRVRLPRLFFVLFHGRARWCVDVSYAGNRGRGGMTGSVAGIRRRRTVAGRRETPHLPPDRDFYGGATRSLCRVKGV